MRKLNNHRWFTRCLIVLALSFMLLGVGAKAMEMCGTIEEERACQAEAQAAWNKAVEGLAWYNPVRLYYAAIYTDRINQCYAPCGGDLAQ